MMFSIDKRSIWSLWPVLLMVMALSASQSAAQQRSATLSTDASQTSSGQKPAETSALAKLVKEAQENNPRVLAARRAWQAAAQVPTQVSTLPDPEVMVQHVSAGTPIPYWDYRKVEMTFTGVGISQSLPYPGKLRLRGDMARRQADSLGDKLEAERRSVAVEAKTTYYQLSYVQKILEIISRDQSLMAQMEKIAEARYRVGQGNQQEVLKAQLERTKLLRDVADAQQQQGSLEARLKQILNRPPDSPDITAEALTETPLPYSPDELLSMARTGNPDVNVQRQMVRSKSVGLELAHKDFLPDFNVQYMWEHTSSVFPDRYSLSVGVKIPIYRSRRQNPELAQAAEELNQSRREYEAQVQQTYFQIKDEFLAADTSEKVLKIYSGGLIPQATAAFQSGLASYQVGGEDFESLLGSFRDVLNLDKEYWRTLADHESSLAKLEQLTGVTLQ